MQSRDKDQTRKTDTHNKEYEATKIIHTNQQKQISNSNSTKNLEHGPGVPVWEASYAFLETPAELLIKSQVQGRKKKKGIL